MSFRDKLESKIAGAVQNFVSPPEFTLPDILFDRLLSTENAEKEEETYYENVPPSNNNKDGGERERAKQCNAPKSSKDKSTIQNNSKEYKIKGALKRHLLLSRDFVLSLSKTKKYFLGLKKIFKEYIDIIMSEHYKKVHSLSQAIKETTKSLDKHIEKVLEEENDDKIGASIKFTSTVIKFFMTIKNVIEHLKNIKDRFQNTFGDNGEEDLMSLVDWKNINSFEDIHRNVIGMMICFMKASSIVINESFKFLWDQVNILLMTSIIPAVVKGTMGFFGSMIKTLVTNKLKNAAVNIIATAISGTGIGFVGLMALNAAWEGAKMMGGITQADLHLRYSFSMLGAMAEGAKGNLTIAKSFKNLISKAEDTGKMNINLLNSDTRYDVPFLDDIYSFTPKNKEKPTYDEIIKFSSRLQEKVYYSKEGAFHGILYGKNSDEITLNYYNLLFTYISDFLRNNLVGKEFNNVINDSISNLIPENIIVQENNDILSDSVITAYDDSLREKLYEDEGNYIYRFDQMDKIFGEIISTKENIFSLTVKLKKSLINFNTSFS